MSHRPHPTQPTGPLDTHPHTQSERERERESERGAQAKLIGREYDAESGAHKEGRQFTVIWQI